jgi:hypothetical protein
MPETRIHGRFCGPPESGNGGYVAGTVAALVGDSAKVRLHAVTPLDCELQLDMTGDQAELKCNGDLLATASAIEFQLDIPPAPTLAEAQEAQKRYVMHTKHVFPGCFVCGTGRSEGDGLRIFPGPVVEGDWSKLACVWHVTDDLADENGMLKPEFIWSALDCPTFFGVMADSPKVALLGEIELRIVTSSQIDEPFIIWCWPISSEGRKRYGGAALATQSGQLLAYARGTWIELTRSI